jgi:hypothetical protein
MASTPKEIVFLVSGYSLAGAITSFEFSGETEMLDATTVNNEGYKTKVAGFKEGTVSVKGLFDSDEADADRIHDVFSAAYADGSVKYILASTGAVSVGAIANMVEGASMKYETPVDTGSLIFSNGEFTSNNGVQAGKWLMHALQAAGTNNGTSLDDGASSANGGYLQVHLHNDDASDVDVKVQHSTDGSTWADLTGAAVSNLSATHASGSASVAAGTTVNRYLRAVATVTGGDTILVSVAFARG